MNLGKNITDFVHAVQQNGLSLALAPGRLNDFLEILITFSDFCWERLMILLCKKMQRTIFSRSKSANEGKRVEGVREMEEKL